MNDYDFLQGKDLLIDTFTLNGSNDQLDIAASVYVQNCALAIMFQNVSSLSLQDLSYPMYFECFEIIDNSSRGWSPEMRYYVHDLEDDHINFYCQNITTIT